MYCRIVGTPNTFTTGDAVEAFSGNVVCLDIKELSHVTRSLALSVNAGWKQININAGNIMAVQPENDEDAKFLDKLTRDIESRKSIIFFEPGCYSYPSSPIIREMPYLYPAELCFKEIPSLLDYMSPTMYAERVMFSKIAEKIAIKKGLQVYRLKANNSLVSVNKKRKETVVLTDCTPKKIQTYIQSVGGL